MKISYFILLLFVGIICFRCQPVSYPEPLISLDDYHIVDGFEMSVVASEPFLEAPVTMDFDNQGRMWVVEMKGYMRNLESAGSDLPNGTISIMEDLDKDGITDHSKIFLDGLVLPRAIAHVYGGLLYTESPNLWFVEIENDKPGNKILVDSLYSDGGNVEHQPNGLMMHIDNWIYNAKSNFRYKRKDGKWIKESTSFRGQWGISKDNFGRLYYNNNSTQIIGDYVLPNTTINNPYYNPKESLNKELTSNQRVYPLHPTSVNRGYVKGILDKDSLLVDVTSACGPLVYRGNQFPDNFLENVFVCVPEANIVKRNVLQFDVDKISAKQAYSNKEFIASTDEGFRPVNLFNGPDGAMYIVDMHRGIIQDKAFLSPYLYNHIANKKLDTIIGMGRILRVQNKFKDLNNYPNLDDLNYTELVNLLTDSNGWIRDRAQQILIYKHLISAIPLLEEIALNFEKPLAQLHAIHTLNGLGASSYELLGEIASKSKSIVIAHTLLLLEEYANESLVEKNYSFFKNLYTKNDPIIDLYLSMSIGSWAKISDSLYFPLYYLLSQRYFDKKIVQEAIISGLRGLEINFYHHILKQENKSDNNDIILELLQTTIKNIEAKRKNSIFIKTSVSTDSRTAGYHIYKNLCATCHGPSGEGIERVAPPLKSLEFIKMPSEKLALILLHGLQGPIHINGVLTEFNGEMPGLINNKEYNNKDIANIISYLQNAFVNTGSRIGVRKVGELRNVTPNGTSFTEEELLKIELE